VRALQEGRSGGQPAACLRAAGRALELGGDRLVGTGGGGCQMPRPAIGIGVRVGGVREREVRRLALLWRRRAVRGRAHERMPECHVLPDRQEVVRLGVVARRRRDCERRRGTPEERRVAEGLGGRQQRQAPGVVAERVESADIALLDSSCQRLRRQQPEAARQLARRHPARQLEQRERVAACLGDDPIADVLVQPERQRRGQQRAGVARAHPLHLEPAQRLELLARLA
jgi:hypothetical protein